MTLEILINVVVVVCLFVPGVLGLAQLGMYLEKRYKAAQAAEPPAWVTKLNANDYTTELSGFKYKIAHRRADKTKWSGSVNAQRRKLIKALEDAIAHF